VWLARRCLSLRVERPARHLGAADAVRRHSSPHVQSAQVACKFVTVVDAYFLDTIRWQFRVAWSLASDINLPRLTDNRCLWLPHPDAETVRQHSNGTWVGDWGQEPAPGEPWFASVAWLTWHLQMWLTQALAEARQQPVPDRGTIYWPGTAAGVRVELDRLATEWQAILGNAEEMDLERPTRFPWPDPRPLHRLLGWANLELMKNVAEIGLAINSATAAVG